MARLRGILFGDGKFIWWIFLPILFCFDVNVLFGAKPWTPTSFSLVVGLNLLSFGTLLALSAPKRFWWAWRGATALVFLAYVAYLIDEVWTGNPWRFGPISRPTPVNALLGLIFIGLPCLRYAILGRFQSKREEVCGISRHVDPCPKCGRLLDQHEWTLFAFTIANQQNKPRLEQFLGHVKAHEWRALSLFSDWADDQSTVEAYAVRCSPGGFVLVLWDPFEPYEPDQLHLLEEISSSEIVEIETLVPAISWIVATPTTG